MGCLLISVADRHFKPISSSFKCNTWYRKVQNQSLGNQKIRQPRKFTKKLNLKN